ncbi:hypothetical protein ASG43_08535 [Aureimonas sp. Leaf454]|uniref:siderophore-interacting protein n=1 Tax=Aureimonas sp. Leaf454 TaxID=1736381 RepID=UPI0006FD9047|nr:siderophore-interacting protein [Aureimonas sp. Leaf454]KQT48879.1 hypothetical protein ASG43_08535 [Aureimonas sp. Leaf454]
MLHARTEIIVADAVRLLADLCEHFSEHGDVSYADGTGAVDFGFGQARLGAEGRRLVVEAKASDEIYLAYMKMGVAEHVHEFAPVPAPEIHWTGDGVTGTIPPFFRAMRVVSAQTLTPHMRRIRLAGRDLGRFAEGGHHVRLIFPPAGREPVWPTLGSDGRIVWPEGEDRLEHRVYTIRRIDPAAGFVDIDIVLHSGEETPGSRFATGARPGDIVGMSGPGGGEIGPASTLILLGDDTALPAIARMLEELPATATVKAVIEVDGPADELTLATKAAADIVYLHRGGRPAGSCDLLPPALRALDLPAFGNDVFVWCGCEFTDFRAIRAYLRKEIGLARHRHLVAAYWRRDRAGDVGGGD